MAGDMGGDYGSTSDSEDEDDNKSEDNHNMTDKNNPVEDATNAEGSDSVAGDQGADGVDMEESVASNEEYNEITVENVGEEYGIVNDAIGLVAPVTQSRTRSGLRNIQNPPGSHRSWEQA